MPLAVAMMPLEMLGEEKQRANKVRDWETRTVVEFP